MANRLAKRVRGVSFVLPTALYERLVRQAARETGDLGRTVTPSAVIRAAIKEYLARRETPEGAPDDAEDEE